MGDAFFELWFASRYIHVASIALLAGGATLASLVCGWPVAGIDAATAVATAYEWIFWAAAALTALTGVSNLGLKGDGLLDPQTTWGVALTIKFALVLLLLALSFVRTEVVRRSRDVAARRAGRAALALAVLYGSTAAAILAIAWIGLGLAHGRY